MSAAVFSAIFAISKSTRAICAPSVFKPVLRATAWKSPKPAGPCTIPSRWCWQPFQPCCSGRRFWAPPGRAVRHIPALGLARKHRAEDAFSFLSGRALRARRNRGHRLPDLGAHASSGAESLARDGETVDLSPSHRSTPRYRRLFAVVARPGSHTAGEIEPLCRTVSAVRSRRYSGHRRYRSAGPHAAQIAALAAAILWTLAWFAVTALAAKIFFAATGAIAVAAVAVDIARGPRCRCHLHTAVTRGCWRRSRASVSPAGSSKRSVRRSKRFREVSRRSGSPIFTRPQPPRRSMRRPKSRSRRAIFQKRCSRCF